MEAERQNPILSTIPHEYEWAYLAFTTDKLGMNIGRSDGKKPKDYSDRAYVKAVVKGAPLAKQVVLGKTSGKPAVILATPIQDTQRGSRSILGVIAMAMGIDELSDRITNTKIGRTGFAFILDDTGKVVAHQQQRSAPATTDFSSHPAYIERPESGGKLVSYQYEGKPVITVVRRSASGWYVVTQQDQQEAYAPLHQAQLRGILVLAFTLVIVSIIAYLFSQGLSRPIKDLTGIADELSRGGTPGNIAEAARSDEIGQLAAAIERMGASIRLAMDRLRKCA